MILLPFHDSRYTTYGLQIAENGYNFTDNCVDEAIAAASNA